MFLSELWKDIKAKAASKTKTSRKKGTAADSANNKEDAKVPEYKVNHLAAFVESGLAWPPEFPADFKASVSHLPVREQEVLLFDRLTQGPPEAMDRLDVRDLHMTIEWGNLSRQIVENPSRYSRGNYL